MAVDLGIVGEHDHISQRHAPHPHMAVSRADQHTSGGEQIARLRLLDLQAAGFIQAPREGFGESAGHVLHHQDGRGKISRKVAEHVLQRIRAAGGDADGNHLGGGAGTARALGLGLCDDSRRTRAGGGAGTDS